MSEAISAIRPSGDKLAPDGRGRRFAARLVSLAVLVAVALPPPVHAQQGGGPKLNVIRDAEIEELLRDYTRPILRAAKLGGQNVEVVIIGDRSFNAFVADARRIFVNVGALYESDTPNQIIGVLAHEAGHIAGGHLARMREQISNAQTAAIVAMLLALGGAAAGARRKSSADRCSATRGSRKSRPTAPRSASSMPQASRARACSKPSHALPISRCF